MSLLRRSLLLAAVAIGGIALLAPLAARSAAPMPADSAEHLLAESDSTRLVVIQRGTLSGRQAVSGEAGDISNRSENLAGEAS